MWSCSVSPLQNNAYTIKINHADKSYSVDKLKFALFSEEIHNNLDKIGEFVNIDGEVSEQAVEQLVSIVNDGKYEITKENCFDLIRLSIELKINSILNDIIIFIEDNFTLDELISKAKETPQNSLFQGLKIALSHKIDSLLLIESFSQLEIEKLIDILTYEGRVYTDHHMLFSFIMNQVSIHHEDALPLLNAIDIQRLSAKEAQQLFANQYFFDPNMEHNYVISDLGRIENRIAEVTARVKQAQGSKTSGKVLNERFDLIQNALEEVTKVIDKNEERSYEKVLDLKDRLNNIQRRVKNDSRRTRADFKTIQSKIKSLESKMIKEFPIE